MIVVALLVAATAALAYGWSEEKTGYVIAALCLSVLAGLLVLAPRALPLLRRLARRPESSAADVRPAAVTAAPFDAVDAPGDSSPEDDSTAWFVPGRTTFHREGCAALGDRPASSGQRAQLEVGGMSACKRCHT